MSRLHELFLDAERSEQAFLTLFEQVYFLGLAGAVTEVKVVVFLILMSLVLAWLWRDRNYLAVTASIFALTVLNLVLYFGSSKFESGGVQPNHIFISYYFYLSWILITIDRCVVAFSHRPFVKPATGAALVVFILTDNYAHPEQWRVPVMTDVGEFLKVAEFYRDRSAELSSKNQYVVLGTASSWGDNHGPKVRIGSRTGSARRLRKADFAGTYGERFVID